MVLATWVIFGLSCGGATLILLGILIFFWRLPWGLAIFYAALRAWGVIYFINLIFLGYTTWQWATFLVSLAAAVVIVATVAIIEWVKAEAELADEKFKKQEAEWVAWKKTDDDWRARVAATPKGPTHWFQGKEYPTAPPSPTRRPKSTKK